MKRRHFELLVERASKHYGIPFTIIDTENGGYAALSGSALAELMLPHLLKEAPPEAPTPKDWGAELLRFLRTKKRGFTRREIQDQFPNLALHELQVRLRNLVRAGQISRWGNTRQMHYMLKM